MWKQQALSITFYMILGLAHALPLEVPRYNQLGYQHPQQTPSSGNNNSVVSTTDRLGYSPTTVTPQFEYALLGQDPTDQHWYRVSLTPTNNKSSYRAEFATRKSPPYDERQAHKHDKTIKELLNFLENSEEHNLLKVYGQLLASEENKEQEGKMKQNEDKVEINIDNDVDDGTDLKSSASRPLILVGELPTATPTNNSQSSNKESNLVKNFVYFIKGLK